MMFLTELARALDALERIAKAVEEIAYNVAAKPAAEEYLQAIARERRFVGSSKGELVQEQDRSEPAEGR